MLEERRGWFGMFSRLQAVEASEPLWRRLQWCHLPRRGSLELTLGAPSPGQRLRSAVPSELGRGSAFPFPFPLSPGSGGARPLPSACFGRALGSSPLAVCAGRNISVPEAAPPRSALPPAFGTRFLCLRVCPWALSHSWAVSWASDVSSLWLQTGFEIIFGKPLAVETDTALPGDGCACQISWVDLPLFHQPPSSSSKTEAQSSEVTETVTQ